MDQVQGGLASRCNSREKKQEVAIQRTDKSGALVPRMGMSSSLCCRVSERNRLLDGALTKSFQDRLEAKKALGDRLTKDRHG